MWEVIGDKRFFKKNFSLVFQIKKKHIVFIIKQNKERRQERWYSGACRQVENFSYATIEITITKSPWNNHRDAADCTLESITGSQTTVKSQYPTRSWWQL